MKMEMHGLRSTRAAAAAFAAVCLLTLAPVLYAAPEASSPVTEVNADVITYKAQTGVISAAGGVRMTQKGTVMTGNTGEYNTKTKTAVVTGNVKIVKEESTLTADEVQSFDNMAEFLAEGNALLVHKKGTAAGPRMEYIPGRQYAKITGGSRLVNQDAVITSSTSEAFFSEDRATADGKVHIVSEARKLDAVADHAVYYGLNRKDGWAELTGNVRAEQGGTVLTGNHVKLYMEDNALDADGRPTLVIQPVKPAEPKITEPKPAEPKSTEPKTAEPKPADPKSPEKSKL